MRLGSRVVHEEGKHPRKVQVWDTPGDAPDDIPTAVFAATDVFVITVDATSQNMLASVPRWVDTIGDVRVVRGRPIPVVLLVTKMDAVSPSPEAILAVRQEALSLGAVLGLTVKFASALDGFGLDETFADIVRMVPVTALMLTPPNSPRSGRTAPRVGVVATPRSASSKGVDSFLGYMQAETQALTGKVGDTVPASMKNRTPLEQDRLSPQLLLQMSLEEVDGGAGGPKAAQSAPSETTGSPACFAIPPADAASPTADDDGGVPESKEGASTDLVGIGRSGSREGRGGSTDSSSSSDRQQGEVDEVSETESARSAGDDSVHEEGGDDAVTPLHEEGLRAHEGSGGRPHSAGSSSSAVRQLSGEGHVLGRDASGASLPGVVEGGAGGVGAAAED